MKRAASQAGYSLVALVATVTIMLIVMSAALPTWRYLMKDEREEELLFRGGQIADAIQAFQEKNGKALPVSLEVLVKGKYLRKLYKDPMTKDGQWRLIHQGQPLPVGAAPGGGPQPSPSPTPRSPAGPGGATGPSLGPIVGVASRSTEKSLRVFNGRSRYDEWIFAAGQPRVVGRQTLRLPQNVVPTPVPPASGGPGSR